MRRAEWGLAAFGWRAANGTKKKKKKEKEKEARPGFHLPEPGRTGKEFSKKAAGCLEWPQESKIPRKTLIGLANQASQWGVTFGPLTNQSASAGHGV